MLKVEFQYIDFFWKVVFSFLSMKNGITGQHKKGRCTQIWDPESPITIKGKNLICWNKSDFINKKSL